MNQNRKAFLDVIAIAEGTKDLGNNGYNVVCGQTLFHSYHDHPRHRVWIEKILKYSTAAGRYQILKRYFDVYKEKLNLPDFSPESQDKIALEMIRECDALDDIDNGRFDTAIEKCKSRWASFPDAGYGQREQKLGTLRLAYLYSGGVITDEVGKGV